MTPEGISQLGEPNLRIGSLRIWIHGRQYPDSEDYFDGNWLVVTAVFQTPDSWVSVTGPILHGPELLQLLEDSEDLYASLTGTATLPCMEPNLRLEMKGNGQGQIEVEVLITPDHLRESHRYLEQIDQSYLPSILTACRQILANYPVKGASQGTVE